MSSEVQHGKLDLPWRENEDVPVVMPSAWEPVYKNRARCIKTQKTYELCFSCSLLYSDIHFLVSGMVPKYHESLMILSTATHTECCCQYCAHLSSAFSSMCKHRGEFHSFVEGFRIFVTLDTVCEMHGNCVTPAVPQKVVGRR